MRVLALALTLTLFVDPPGLPDTLSPCSSYRDKLLAQTPPLHAFKQSLMLLADKV